VGKSYYIFSPVKIRRKENTVYFEIKKEKNIEKRTIPVEEVEEIFFFNEVEMNSRFLSFASHYNIVLHFFNYYGYYTGSFYPRGKNPAGYVIVKQVEHYIERKKRMQLARKFVEASLHNIRRILQKRKYTQEEQKIKEYEELVEKTSTPSELMVHEAHARRAYYSVWEKITGWDFKSREMHPPLNELNALISFGNALLYAEILKELYKTPLNPTISYLHEPGEKRFSLSLDIAEIFKPLFVDRLIFRLISQRKLLKEKHFIACSNGTLLNEEGRKVFVQEFDGLLNTVILHRSLRRKVKYRTLLRLEAYKLLKHIIGEKPYKPLKVWW